MAYTADPLSAWTLPLQQMVFRSEDTLEPALEHYIARIQWDITECLGQPAGDCSCDCLAPVWGVVCQCRVNDVRAAEGITDD